MTQLPDTTQNFWPLPDPPEMDNVWCFDSPQNSASQFLAENWAHHRHMAGPEGMILKGDIPYQDTWFSNKDWALMVLKQGSGLMYKPKGTHAEFLPVPLHVQNPTAQDFDRLCEWAETQPLRVGTYPQSSSHFPWWGHIGFQHYHLSEHLNTLFSFLYAKAKLTHKARAGDGHGIRWKMMRVIDAQTLQMPDSSFIADSAESAALIEMGHFVLTQETPFRKDAFIGQKSLFGHITPEQGPLLQPKAISRHEMLNWMRTHADWEHKTDVHHANLETTS